MPPVTIRVLSWNVESLGDTKAVQPGSNPPAASELINFINLVARKAYADVLGIMEVKSGQGATVRAWLLSKLNNVVPAPAYRWRGIVSTRQDGGTKEEYVVLWKARAGRLTLDLNAKPAPASLIGVVDDNAFSWLFTAKSWGASARTTFYAALGEAKYTAAGRFKNRNSVVVTAYQRVLPAAWEQLDSMMTPQVTWSNQTPPPGPTTTQDDQDIAAALLDIDILRFVTNGDRSPFLVNFLVGQTRRPLAIALFHAPGPQDKLRTDAINIIALSRPAGRAATGGNLLLMGDFNIAAANANDTARVYDRFTNAQQQFVFAQVTPVQTKQVFAPITGTPGLNAPDLIGNQRTSLINAYIADGSPINAALANTYDKFFFHGAAAMTSANPRVINLVDHINPAATPYSAALATSAMAFFRSLRGAAFLTKQAGDLQRAFKKHDGNVTRLTKQLAQITARITAAGNVPANSALLKRQATTQKELNEVTQNRAAVTVQITALNVVTALVNNAAANAPTGVGTALTTYRYAVSDHLPISVDLSA